MGKMKYPVSLAVIFAVWQSLSLFFGSQLVPGPSSVGREMVRLLARADGWEHVFITVFRGATGVALSFLGALALGIPCGLGKKFMDIVSPLVAASQGCPPIIWISLLMVWVGMSSMVPIAVIVVSLFPVLFFNVAQGVASLDSGLFAMARTYRAGRARILKDILLPGIRPYLLSSLSYSLGVAWKVTATAEFFGSPAGIGSRLYWSYRYLDMPQLFCWAAILVAMGFSIETFVIDPLRREYGRQAPGGGA